MFYNTLNNLNQKNYNLELDLTQIQTKDKNIALEIGKNYYIKGLTGSGKTTIALQLAKGFIQKMEEYIGESEANAQVKFVKFFKLIKLLQSYDKDDRREVKSYMEAKLLIIDDFGVGYGKEFSLVELEDFFDERMGRGDDGVTIITTNINFEEAENQELKRALSRILSRIGAMCTYSGIIELEQKDKRFGSSQHETFNFSKYKQPESVSIVQGENESEDDLRLRIEAEKSKGNEVKIEYNQETQEKHLKEFQKLKAEVKKTLNLKRNAPLQMNEDQFIITKFKLQNGTSWQEIQAEMERNRQGIV